MVVFVYKGYCLLPAKLKFVDCTGRPALGIFGLVEVDLL